MSNKRLEDNIVREILVSLFVENEGVTKTAKNILGRKSRESTVRHIKKVYEKYGNYYGISLDTEVTESEDNFVLPDATLDHLCDNPDWSISNLAKRLRAAQRSNNQLRKIQRDAFDGKGEPLNLQDMLKHLSKCFVPKSNFNILPIIKPTNTTVEILFSDWQFGKISECWDSVIAEKASKYYGQEVLRIILESQPEKIIFSALGDNIEDSLKHGIQSTASTDTSNAEQMANCISQVWYNILEPIFMLKIPVEFVGIAGNHGSSEHKGMDMFKAGRYSMDYVLYKTWETMSKISGFDHIVFNLPEGHFTTYEIYGKLTVAEHGYEAKGSSEAALITLRNKRATNLQKFVHRLVVGDMHHVCSYDNGNLQVNGAPFGVAFDAIEYSGIMGFHSIPAQIVNIHAPTTGVGQNTVVETKVIQIAKGY